MSNRFHRDRYADKPYSPKNHWGTPGRKWKSVWNQTARAIQNRRLRVCKDFEELQIETKIQKITSIYDWY